MKLLLLVACFALSLAAADISGNWKGVAETDNGTFERTFTFKVDGAKLTGETNSERTGKSVLKNGKIDGEKVTFSIDVKIQDNDMTLNYLGTVKGDEILFKVDFPGGGGPTIEYKTKRVQ